jgi:hypothetical protein
LEGLATLETRPKGATLIFSLEEWGAKYPRSDIAHCPRNQNTDHRSLWRAEQVETLMALSVIAFVIQGTSEKTITRKVLEI